MDAPNSHVHHVHMAKPSGKNRKVTPRFKAGPRRTFIREWRVVRGLTLERLADRIGTTHASLSRIERGMQPYSQPILEGLATALQTDVASLLIRNPLDGEAPWSIWDSLKPEQRRQAIRLMKALAEEEAA
jgi:transcriptional regulator with XRE-family HTH domain